MQPDQQPQKLGRRIVTWGATGSGKTTFTHRFGAALGLRIVQLDAIRHESGWDSVDWPEFRARLTALLDCATNGWITDGSYSPVADIYLSRADTVIWLHLPWRVSFWRLLKRTLGRAFSKEPLYNPSGPRESLRLTFFSPKSILWWSISHHRPGERNFRERIARLPDSVSVYELSSSKDIEALLALVEGRRAPTR